MADRPARVGVRTLADALLLGVGVLAAWYAVVPVTGVLLGPGDADAQIAGMWAVVAVAFVFSDRVRSSEHSFTGRMAATVVSSVLCSGYLLVLPVTPFGTALVVAVGVVVLAALGLARETVTTSITTAVVLVVAGLDGADRGWEDPILRIGATLVGGIVGLAAALAAGSGRGWSREGRGRPRPRSYGRRDREDTMDHDTADTTAADTSTADTTAVDPTAVDPTAFDPTDFALVPARTFEELEVGEVFRAPSRTLTAAHASAFQAVSADNHPVHYDDVWARAHGHTAPVVHGLQVLAFTAPGATLFPHVIGEVFIAITGLSCEFHAEVHAGATLYSQLTLTALEAGDTTGTVTAAVTVHDQDGTLVLSGEHRYLLRLRAA